VEAMVYSILPLSFERSRAQPRDLGEAHAQDANVVSLSVSSEDLWAGVKGTLGSGRKEASARSGRSFVHK